ncbi:type II secretion system F family protein [Puniceicoccaceae bacterium K14]|nr:type II secretion system F family protein [Puniceicoccaceae bacterium K14]
MAYPSDKQVAAWFRQVSDSLRSGLGPVESVELADSISSPSIESFRYYLETGGSWEDGLREHLDFLNETELAICEASSKSGGLAEAMEQLAISRDAKSDFRGKLLLSCLYPTVLVHFSLLAVPLNKLMDGDFTGYAEQVGKIFAVFWGVSLISILVLKTIPAIRRRLSELLPIVSGYKRSRDLGIFCRTLSTAMNAGLNLDYSWALAVRCLNAKRYEVFGERVLEVIYRGEPASNGFKEVSWLPKNFVSFYKSGERSGGLVENLVRLAEEFEKKAKRKLAIAAILYPKIVLLAAVVLAAYQIVVFYMGHLNDITSILD